MKVRREDSASYALTAIANENYNTHSRVTDKISSEKIWFGRAAFIIGGGESLRGFDFTRLNKYRTIGVNRSFEAYDSDFLFFGDYPFYSLHVANNLKTLARWNSLKAIKCTLAPQVKTHNLPKDVCLIRRYPLENLPKTLDNGINHKNNSGYGAIMLAYLLGANPIYLLGFDGRCLAHTHWHDGYEGQTLEEQNQKVVESSRVFAKTSRMFELARTRIINLNENSALDCFPKAPLDSVL